MSLPIDVTEDDISIDGSFPVFIAPVKPYKEFAVTLRANYLAFKTLYSKTSLAFFIYFLTFLRSAKTDVKIYGNNPSRIFFLKK